MDVLFGTSKPKPKPEPAINAPSLTETSAQVLLPSLLILCLDGTTRQSAAGQSGRMQHATCRSQEADGCRQGYTFEYPEAESTTDSAPQKDVRHPARVRHEPTIQHRPGRIRLGVNIGHDKHCGRLEGRQRGSEANYEGVQHGRHGGSFRRYG